MKEKTDMQPIVIAPELLANNNLTLAEKLVAAFIADGKVVGAQEVAQGTGLTLVTAHRTRSALVAKGVVSIRVKGVAGMNSYAPVGYPALKAAPDGNRLLFR